MLPINLHNFNWKWVQATKVITIKNTVGFNGPSPQPSDFHHPPKKQEQT